jgi:uncharacterized membrane protein YqgA involved in biofilm formation
MTGLPLRGFSAIIPGWEVFLYNVIGAAACTGILVGMFKQRKKATIGQCISGLLIEKYSTGVLFLVISIYVIHNIARQPDVFPYILVFLAGGLVGKWFEIRRELKNIKDDLTSAGLVSERAKAGVLNE